MPIHVNKGKPQRLDTLLCSWLPELLGREVSRSQVRELLVKGFVYLDGRVAKTPSRQVKSEAQVEVTGNIDVVIGKGESKVDFNMAESFIVFEDDDLIAVNKPYGLPTQPTLDPGRINLFDEVKKYLKNRDDSEYLGLHHRLDRDTTGIVLFTKSRRVNRGIASQFSGHTMNKTYHAIVWVVGAKTPSEIEWQKTWTISNFLGRDKRKHDHLRPRTHVFQGVRSGGQTAETEFGLIKKKNFGAWVEAKPKTGRTHQIRIHLAEAGMPVIGDRIYGGIYGDEAYTKLGMDRMYLHAHKLEFEHPLTQTRMEIQCDVPSEFSKKLLTMGLRKAKS